MENLWGLCLPKLAVLYRFEDQAKHLNQQP
jgi:hypothetical protein